MTVPVSLSDALDEALSMAEAGHTPESIPSSFPQHAAALTSLLQTARQMTDLRVEKQMPPEVLAAGRRRMLEAAAVHRQGSLAARLARACWQSASLTLQRRPVMTALAALVVLLGALGGGAVFASGDSLPDSPLYPVKLAVEKVQLTLAFDAEAQGELAHQFEERRQSEMLEMERRRLPIRKMQDRETKAPDPPATAVPSTATVAQQPGAPGGSLQPSGTPEAGDTPRPTTGPEPGESPRATRSPEQREKSEPSPTRPTVPTPKPTETPEARETPKPGGVASPTPKAAQTAEATQTPVRTRTPTATPEAKAGQPAGAPPVAGAVQAPASMPADRPSQAPLVSQTTQSHGRNRQRHPPAPPGTSRRD